MDAIYAEEIAVPASPPVGDKDVERRSFSRPRIRRIGVISNEVIRPDGQPASITFTAGLPGPFDGPCIFLRADGPIHAGEIVRNSKTFLAGALSTTNSAGDFHEEFEIPLRKVVGWAVADPRDDRAPLATADV